MDHESYVNKDINKLNLLGFLIKRDVSSELSVIGTRNRPDQDFRCLIGSDTGYYGHDFRRPDLVG